MPFQSRPLIDPVREEFSDALATLDKVLVLGSDRRTDPTVRVSLFNSVIVAIVSTAEESLKDLFRTYLDILEQNIDRHSYLPNFLQTSNLDGGVAILRAILKSDRSTAANIAAQVAQCLTGGVGYVLFKDELTNNRGNFRSSQVTSIAKNVGLGEIWQAIADSAEVESLTGEAEVLPRTNDLIRRWNEVYDERDTIVHRISQANGWAEGRIREAMALFKCVIGRVADCLSTSADSLLDGHHQRVAGEQGSSAQA